MTNNQSLLIVTELYFFKYDINYHTIRHDLIRHELILNRQNKIIQKIYIPVILQFWSFPVIY